MTYFHTHILGFPRIGKNREFKKALEAYWNSEISEQELQNIGKDIRKYNWEIQKDSGLDYITVGDFSWYDHILETSALLGVVPSRFKEKIDTINLDSLFLMARGQSSNSNNISACDMTKWFNTNYHYIVPEFTEDQNFTISTNTLFEHIDEAQEQGYLVKPVLVGPLTYLWLGKASHPNFDKLTLIKNIIPIYNQIFKKLKEKNIDWVQIDEPILTLDLSPEWINSFSETYQKLNFNNLKILLATYFGSIEDKIEQINRLPIHGLHVDLCSNPEQIESIINQYSVDKVLSVGVINGRNIWKSDLFKIESNLNYLKNLFGENLWISASCSLLHSPVDLDSEHNIDPEIKNWLAFAKQKIQEISLVSKILSNSEDKNTNTFIIENFKSTQSRLKSNKVHNSEVQKNINLINENYFKRKSDYKERAQIQKNKYNLPLFPTTTIGSFPQTKEIRGLRKKLKDKKIDLNLYNNEIKKNILDCIQRQEKLDIDVLVHGEAERNDMVEFFGELLEGFIFTSNGWVQSYGSRCVKPPVIYGDVYRKKPLTLEWTSYAQSLTERPVKGMLTGPVTIISWSFVRDDQPIKETAKQIALALREETIDLEKAGIKFIQIDEPAFREALPLKKKDWKNYFDWAIPCFKIASCGISDETQIHTHMCYSEFNDIISYIAELDADVITIECSRSNMELLSAFENYCYPNEIGPGIYDIHSPNIPNTDLMVNNLKKALNFISKDKLWINPDCGLKTRNWPEVEYALKNMVLAAKELRKNAT
ncbi:5-methyltetrahydropteroyltriglutamate--homocysteine S-methyltransferase [Silvanigrella paludirubra]|uniref:5-methyltetrahydropteroyltriglutamate--homocysteine methyltransferase n=1 Tax=Silvanigrella paludirubra TaxID=2499159 RepID=A0A6N6VUE2_9BACT|nr:5-methyltetrahydropteroyltriglutamate--homocysteine S-methyltransferase [Silvanigrella paludirubra]KAB8037059.1 5-methyltetrahydropteroyltriglutamate--homocysteine S-methyltransferase [Silvanigrella paludirubra]